MLARARQGRHTVFLAGLLFSPRHHQFTGVAAWKAASQSERQASDFCTVLQAEEPRFKKKVFLEASKFTTAQLHSLKMACTQPLCQRRILSNPTMLYATICGFHNCRQGEKLCCNEASLLPMWWFASPSCTPETSRWPFFDRRRKENHFPTPA